jgi:hypothetical protein
MSWKKNHRIALTDKFSIVAAHHWSLLNPIIKEKQNHFFQSWDF